MRGSLCLSYSVFLLGEGWRGGGGGWNSPGIDDSPPAPFQKPSPSTLALSHSRAHSLLFAFLPVPFVSSALGWNRRSGGGEGEIEGAQVEGGGGVGRGEGEGRAVPLEAGRREAGRRRRALQLPSHPGSHIRFPASPSAPSTPIPTPLRLSCILPKKTSAAIPAFFTPAIFPPSPPHSPIAPIHFPSPSPVRSHVPFRPVL